MLQIHDYYSGERWGISELLSGKILINPKKKLEGSLFLNLLYHLSRSQDYAWVLHISKKLPAVGSFEIGANFTIVVQDI